MKKFDFDGNPALQFISSAGEDQTKGKSYKPAEDIRNKRVQILLSQATDRAARAAAAERGQSLNGFINDAITAYLKKGAKKK